nr:MAG TPA_asm: hypothetical protein [Caudoviricetes sp.]
MYYQHDFQTTSGHPVFEKATKIICLLFIFSF